jgi:cell wall-associated NlpC family hydrolase
MKTILLFIKLPVVMLFTLTLAGCAMNSTKPANTSASAAHHPFKIAEKELLGYYSQWQGTPYRYGKNSRKGLDCSAFVQNAYGSVFNVDIPRTTLAQAKLGTSVNKSELIPGDLVLFKTSRSVRHVGIVVNGNKFMHVSEKKGVTISALDNVYWRKKYWKAVRPENGINI